MPTDLDTRILAAQRKAEDLRVQRLTAERQRAAVLAEVQAAGIHPGPDSRADDPVAEALQSAVAHSQAEVAVAEENLSQLVGQLEAVLAEVA